MISKAYLPQVTYLMTVKFFILIQVLFIHGGLAHAATLSQNVNFYAGSPNQQTSSLIVNPNTQVADGNLTIQGMLVVRDAFGNPINNQNVVFTTPSGVNINCTATGPTNSSGQSSVTCTSTKAQSANLKADLPSLWSQNANITFNPGNPNLANSLFTSDSPTIANNTNIITATLLLLDTFNNPVSNQNITFTTTSSNATLTPTSITTDANGIAKTQIRSTKAQTASLTAQFSSSSLNTSIVFNHGPASASYSSIILDTNSQVTNSNITYSIHIADAYNNPIPNQNLVLSVSGIGGKIVNPIVSTNSDANYQSTITSPYVGTNILRATVSPLTLTASMSFSASSSGCGGNPNYVLSTFNVNGQIRYFDIGDINRDGYPDMVISYLSVPQIGIMYGQGNGSYSTPVLYTQVASPNDANSQINLLSNSGITVRDIDRDGFDDIVIISNSNQGVVSVLYGSSANPLTRSYSFNTNGSNPINAAIGDLNGDGYLDVVASDYGDNKISVLFGNQTQSPNALTFAYTKTATVSRLWSSIVADVDDDGYLDVLTSTNNGGSTPTPVLNIFWGNSGASLSNPNVYTNAKCPQMSAVGHFSSTTYLDVLALATCDSNILVFPGQGTKTLGTPWILPINSGYIQAIALEDLNADGVLDLVSTNTGCNCLRAYTGHIGNANNFTVARELAIGNTPTNVKIWDMNKDGNQDIIFTASNSNTMGIFSFVNCN